MISFLLSLVILFAGYMIYGKVVERVFQPDDRPTPAIEINDGVDCVTMKPWKAFLVQLLNIALEQPDTGHGSSLGHLGLSG